ncbi:MAG: hypothetical protein QOE44_3119, partial [Solirubrobacteraceae bacterium]|nr:hypothetical protein [Solirubrobacteraceae bacterium]
MELIRKLVRSPELARECEALAAAPADHIGRTAGAMAEWLRERLGPHDPRPGVPVLELGPAAEDAVRRAVASEPGRVPVYALARAGEILERLGESRRRLGAAEIAVVVDAPLRRHVHRLLAAQFPTAAVIARHELDPDIPRERVDLSDG